MDLFGQSNQIQNLFVDDQVPKSKPSNKASKKKTNKQDYASLMQSAPKTPFKCKKHPELHMKFRSQQKNTMLCGSCGFKCQGKSGFVTCQQSGNCFSLCSVCRICPKNHILRNCISLKQFQAKSKNPLHAQNKFKCQGCEKEQSVGAEGVMHCPSCSFSICMGCIKEYDRMWEGKVTGEDEKEDNKGGEKEANKEAEKVKENIMKE